MENASLLPWLAVTAALHTSLLGGGRLARSTAALTVGALGLAVSGVWLTRSGTTGSIHAFAEDADVARPLLAFAVVVVAAGAVLAVRAGTGPTGPVRRSMATLAAVQATLAAVAIVAIALGTFWPAFDELIGGTRSTVRPEYYHRVLTPVVVAVLIGLVAWPILAARAPARRIAFGAAAGALVAGSASAALGSPSTVALVVATLAGGAIGAGVLAMSRPGRRGVAVAHSGFAVLILGAMTASGGTDVEVTVPAGEQRSAEDITVGLRSLEATSRQRYEAVSAVVAVTTGDRQIVATPELRAYEEQQVPTIEAVIDSAPTGDTIVMVSAVEAGLDWARVIVRTRPLMPWVWVGAVMMLGGGLASAVGHRARSATERDATTDRVG